MDAHVAAVAAAAPSLRVAADDIATAWGAAGARGTAAVCPPDEDTLTLAADAAGRAIARAEIDPSLIDGLWWATTTPPFADGPSHAYLSAALGLAPHVVGALVSGSTHAGAEALCAAWDAIGAGTARVALVVVSDAPTPALASTYEQRAGAGAVAFVLTLLPGAAVLRTRITNSRPVLDRYRGTGHRELRDIYDPRLAREEIVLPEVQGAIDAVCARTQPTAWSLPDLDGRSARGIAARLGTDDHAAVVARAIGDAGAAAPLLGLAHSLATAGTAGAVIYGGGRTTALVVEANTPVPGADAILGDLGLGRPASYAEVLRAREQLVAGGDPIPMGVPPTGAGGVRGATELLALQGARCVDCGTISTPPSVHPTCTGCGGAKLEVVALARSGVVHTAVVNRTMPAPFVAPLPIVIVDLDDGARLQVQAVGDGSDITVGTRVELVLRRYATERGAPIYGYKARVAAARRDGEDG